MSNQGDIAEQETESQTQLNRKKIWRCNIA